MKRFKRLLAISSTETPDPALLRWAKGIAEAAEAQGVDIIQCEPRPLPVYPEIQEALGDGGEEKESFQRVIAEHFGEIPHKIIEPQDSPIKAVLHLLAEGVYDLVLVSGSKHESRILAERLARKSPVGVLYLPQDSSFPPHKITAGFDFSELSPIVLERAELFANLTSSEKVELQAVHVVEAPLNDRATAAITPEALQRLLVGTGTRLLNDFLTEKSQNANRWQQTIVSAYFPSKALTDIANGGKVDLLVIASQGKGALSAALLGSDAAEVVRHIECPVLIAKNKNESLGFLRSLLGLS